MKSKGIRVLKARDNWLRHSDAVNSRSKTMMWDTNSAENVSPQQDIYLS